MTKTSPKLIVCSRGGSLRPHFRPSIASAAELAEAYAVLLPLIAGGEIGVPGPTWFNGRTQRCEDQRERHAKQEVTR